VRIIRNTNTVRTSQETPCLRYRDEPVNTVWETVAVYSENHTEHTVTVRTSRETHYVSAIETNRLVLFRETVAVYCRESERKG
jgi:hypothetical protein